MARFHSINGRLVDAASAAIGISDLGLLRGYGIFDFFLVRRGVPMFVDDYLARFERSARILGLALPLTVPELRRHILQLIQANDMEEAAIRLLLTGGYADDGYTPAVPNWMVLHHDQPHTPAERYEQGVKLMTWRHVRELPEVKSTNYLTAIQIRHLLQQAGAPEVLYHDGVYVSESARSNFFALLDTGVLVTPAQGVLHGITRKQVRYLASQVGIPVEERPLRLDELPYAQEAFLTSTVKGVLPVVQIDEQRIGTGHPGPLAQQLGQAFEAHCQAYIAAFTP